MAQKLKTQSGRSNIGDHVDESKWLDLRGTAWASPVTRVDLTNSFVNVGTDPVLDCEDYDTVLVLVDYTKGNGTGLRLKALFGIESDEAKLDVQEDREDNSGAGVVAYEAIEHSFAATFRGFIEIKRVSRFMKLQAKSLGTPDTGDELAIAVVGQKRDR